MKRRLGVVLSRVNVREVVLAGLGVELLMCLFPPWRTQVPQGFSLDTGYSFLFSPPNQLAEVDVGHLLVQMLLVGISTAAVAIFLMRGRSVAALGGQNEQ